MTRRSLLLLFAFFVLFPGSALADEWTEYVGPALPEYDVAPTPPPPSGYPVVHIHGGSRTSESRIEVITVLERPLIDPLPAWNDPIVSGLDIEHEGRRASLTYPSLLDNPVLVARDNIPGCTPERYCFVRLRAVLLVPTGNGNYDVLLSEQLAVTLPPASPDVLR